VRFVLYAVGTLEASELVESARRLGWELVAAVSNIPEVPVPSDVEPLVAVDDLPSNLLSLPFAVPQTGPDQRREAIADARRRGFVNAATMIDPTSMVASNAVVGDASYIGAGAVLGAALRAGTGCLVNRSCSLAHHVVLGDYVTMGPGVVVAGACRIGDRAFLGAGAVLVPQVTIGEGAVVGAGAVVISDVEPGTVVVGNPARVLRRVSD
jgi:sugar O-acyltransferase (sialic acid O-acetyltransferase NeuD family)